MASAGKSEAETSDAESARPAFFATTHWSLVLAAGGSLTPAARHAWEELAANYWQPLYAHIRRRGATHENAQDLVQAFFAHLIEKGAVQSARRDRGRFRTFLLASFEHFLANAHDRATALKRGGEIEFTPWPMANSDNELTFEPAASSEPPERQFDCDWAHGILDRALVQLAAEFAEDGKSQTWEVLRPFLFRSPEPGEYEAAAARQGISPMLLRKAVSRLRQRLRMLVRAEIAHTVATVGEVEEELRYLVDVIAGT